MEMLKYCCIGILVQVIFGEIEICVSVLNEEKAI